MRDFEGPGRSAAMAATGRAATAHPEATRGALDVLRDGGNAMDAALAAVAVQCVVEPAMTGVGGDCFCLYSEKGAAPVALNGSGRAPAAATVESYRAKGNAEIPWESPEAVTVPGAVDAWCRLHEDHGSKDFAELLAPAIARAEDGYVVTPRVARDFAVEAARVRSDPDCAAVFHPGGQPPKAGDTHAQPKLAATLKRIAAEGRAGFYEGPVMADIVAKLSRLGGVHAADDFAAQHAEYVQPIHALYRDHDIHECPPNGQGLAALMILRALDGYDLSREAMSEADRHHLLAEVSKMAYSVRDHVFGDPKFTDVPVEALLSDDRAEWVRGRISMETALHANRWNGAEHKDTVYLCVVDKDRNAVSFINSLFKTFGSCIMAPESGVLLHNRGISFRLDPDHPNRIEPGKRPMHTIIPAMAMKDGKAVMPFGVMGGHYQSTGHAHFLMRMLDLGLDPQQAAEAPRSFCFDGEMALERRVGEDVAEDLRGRGHNVTWAGAPHGGCQAIYIDDARGVLVGGSDPRKDGLALGY